MAAGTVTGDASIGTDTLRSIEAVQGTIFNDTSTMQPGYGGRARLTSATTAIFNQFEGLGGDDTITGNGNTRVDLRQCDGRRVHIDWRRRRRHGTAAGDVAKVGTDTFTGGVNSVTGSTFGDTLTGDANSNTFVGGGNDSIDGGAGGNIANFSVRGRLHDHDKRRGSDYRHGQRGGARRHRHPHQCRGAESTDANLLIASGSSANRSTFRQPALLQQGGQFADRGDGVQRRFRQDQLRPVRTSDRPRSRNERHRHSRPDRRLQPQPRQRRAPGRNFRNNSVSLAANVDGLTIDIGRRQQQRRPRRWPEVPRRNQQQDAAISRPQRFQRPPDLLNDVTGLSVNLANGTNTLNLAAGANSFTNLFNVDTVAGSISDDTLSIANSLHAEQRHVDRPRSATTS